MIAIYEDQQGELRPDDFEPVSVYDEGEWVVDRGGYSTYYPEGTPEDAIAAQLDGPDPVAVEVTEDADALLNEIQKSDEHTDGEASSVTEREVDSESGEDAQAPWQTSEEEKSIGAPRSSTLADFDVFNVDPEDLEEREEKSEGSGDGRVHIDRRSEAPDGKIVHAGVDEEGDTEGLYYEQ